MRRSHDLRELSLADFRTEDLRIMIGQGGGSATLIPLALHLLADDPLAEGNLCPGDLLVPVLGLGESCRKVNPAPAATLADTVKRVDLGAEEVLFAADLTQLIGGFLDQP